MTAADYRLWRRDYEQTGDPDSLRRMVQETEHGAGSFSAG